MPQPMKRSADDLLGAIPFHFVVAGLDPAICATRQVAGNTDVKSAVRPVRYDVNPSSLHGMIVRMKKPECNRGADGRVKPGHDGKRV